MSGQALAQNETLNGYLNILPTTYGDTRSVSYTHLWAGGSNETAPGLTSPMKQNGNGKVYPLNKNYVFGIEFTF